MRPPWPARDLEEAGRPGGFRRRSDVNPVVRCEGETCWDIAVNILPFTIEVDRSTGLICATAHQFWTLATMERFEARIRVEHDAVRRSGLRPLLLIDVRQHGVQSREVVQGLQKFANSANGRETKTAVVVESALYRLQAARIGSGPHHAIFRDEREARDWLLADRENDSGKTSSKPA